jgi:hypothetical protein
MEQANYFAAMRIKSGNVRTLKAIAMNASEGEILKHGRPPVPPRNDVVHLERRRLKCRGQLAILTVGTGPLPNPTDEIGVQDVLIIESRAAKRGVPWTA